MGPAVKKQKVGSKGKVVMKNRAGKALSGGANAPAVVPSPANKASTKKAITKEEDEEKSASEVSEDSASEVESLGDLSDEDLNDELDVADVSSDEEIDDLEVAESDENDEDDSEDDSDSDSDSYPKLKKKKNLDDGSASFSAALNAIVGSKLKSYDRKDPILARNKTTIKKLESDKLEAKAKRALLAEKKDISDKFRIKQILPSSSEPEKIRQVIENERKLKKIAQKGVVRLFNAVLSTQINTSKEISQEKVGDSRKEELINEISKEKFLDLVQAAGDE